jgi:hypothetical protein
VTSQTGRQIAGQLEGSAALGSAQFKDVRSGVGRQSAKDFRVSSFAAVGIGVNFDNIEVVF